MAQVRYYLDQHIAGAVAEGLRRRGVEVVTLTEAEMLGATEEAHFAFAREEGRTHAGVVYMPQRRSIGETVRGLALIAGVLDAECMRRHVEFLCGTCPISLRYNHLLLGPSSHSTGGTWADAILRDRRLFGYFHTLARPGP